MSLKIWQTFQIVISVDIYHILFYDRLMIRSSMNNSRAQHNAALIFM